MTVSKLVINIKRVTSASMLAVMLLAGGETIIGVESAYAQETQKKKRATKKILSVSASNAKIFEKAQAAFEAENYTEVEKLLKKIEEKPTNAIENAYLANYRGNICFSQDKLNCALRQFRKITDAGSEGISESFYNQMLYVVAQVLFSQEKYGEALKYAQRWFKTQEDPSADAYLLVGQAHYMLKDYNRALPNVQKGIDKYIALGSVPKESWLNLLANIYRQKNQYRKMLPVLKELVKHYPKKTYLTTLAGVYNELDDQAKMTAMYQAMYDQGLLTTESEYVTLASLLLSQESPYPASQIMKKGLDSGVLKKTLKNYRIYSQSLYASREYEDALKPLEIAASKSKDGKLYNQLGQSYIALNRWREAEAALSKAISKGKLNDGGQAIISKGLTQFEQKKFKSAEATFQSAVKYEKVSSTAANWIKYVKAEVRRLEELNAPIQEIDTSVEPVNS